MINHVSNEQHPGKGTQNMNKKKGYTIAGATLAIIAACAITTLLGASTLTNNPRDTK